VTNQPSAQFKLTLEQRQKLGQVYLMILDWRRERERKKIREDEHGLQDAVTHDQSISDHCGDDPEGEV
jgi:hypothetical protein